MTAEEYYRLLSEVMSATRVLDSEGKNIGLNEGVDLCCDILVRTEKSGKKVILIGNGGSAGIASHMAVDIWKNGGIRATAFNDSSLLTCIGNDFGYEHVFEKPMEMFAEPGDVLIAISSSGSSENILLGADAARKKGLSVITFSGFEVDNPLSAKGDVNFYTPCRAYGPVEVLHQLLCHCILDTVMIKQGKLKRDGFVCL
jgi:D-sedoheptulose 7-phosphate isomerase